MKYKFTPENYKKIAKGALIAATGSAALALLDFAGTVEIENALLASFVAWVVPVATNAIKEWLKDN